MARSESCLWTILVVLHSVSPVSSWAYLLSIHSCLLDILLAKFLESCNKLASSVLEAIAIGLRKWRVIKFKYALVITSEVTSMQN